MPGVGKLCRKCGALKALGEFYAHPKTRDRLLAHCKPCHNVASRESYRKSHDSRRSYDRNRDKLPDRMLARNETNIALRKRHPERYAARKAVTLALKAGRMLRMPCCKCGDPQSEAHHTDYSRHLDIIWLCRKHHQIEHGRYVLAESVPV